jgi:hypothetical protein
MKRKQASTKGKKLLIENRFLFISRLMKSFIFLSRGYLMHSEELKEEKKSSAFIMFPHKSLIYERFLYLRSAYFNNEEKVFFTCEIFSFCHQR